MALQGTVGVPSKGWNLDDVVDSRDESGLHYGEYEDCEYCNHEQIRYVHILSHNNYHEQIHVGCICAEHLTGDYVNPKKRERALKNRASRRSRFLTRKWSVSYKGNHSISYQGYRGLAFKTPNGKFKTKIGQTWGNIYHTTMNEAKLYIFDTIESLKK